ncbi:hypothetical protein [Pseudomonas moorei]
MPSTYINQENQLRTIVNLDLNGHNFTLDDVRRLIASKDDSADRQLRVTKDGLAYLSDTTGSEEIDNLCFRLETWDEGTDYVGQKAAIHDEWVSKIYECLKNNWPTPVSRLIDQF